MDKRAVQEVKLIQVNGWCGRLNGPLSRFIHHQEPDIICIQEAFAPNTTALVGAFSDQYGYIDEIINVGEFPYNFFAPAWGFEMVGKTIEFGNVILSKFPISDQQSFHTFNRYHVRGKLEDVLKNARIWQACTITLPNSKKLSVANHQAYLSGANPLGDNVSVKAMKKVRDGLAALPHPLIFCGDLNVSPKSPALQVLNELGLKNLTVEHGVQTTLSSAHRASQQDRESVICDYIFVSEDVQVQHFTVSDDAVSDHKALVLEFDMPNSH